MAANIVSTATCRPKHVCGGTISSADSQEEGKVQGDEGCEFLWASGALHKAFVTAVFRRETDASIAAIITVLSTVYSKKPATDVDVISGGNTPPRSVLHPVAQHTLP